MAGEATGSVPEGLATDEPVDVDFNAVIARAQSTFIMQGAQSYRSNADRREMMRDFGYIDAETPDPAPPEDV